MPRATIYGDYVAPAIASTSSCWHIRGSRERIALCGAEIKGDVRQMDLHVSFLECSTCMKLGGEAQVDELKAAIRAGLKKCVVSDGSPVSLIRDSDLFHITHMVAAEVQSLLDTKG